LLFLLLASQLMIAAYLNNLAFDAAAEGATVAATYDGGYSPGKDRAIAVLGQLAGAIEPSVTAVKVSRSAGSVWRFTVRIDSGLLWFGGASVHQTAEALCE
jgi:hypothetical protein